MGWWSYVLAALGITSLYVAATRPRIGWRMSIGVQAVWVVYAIATRQWGFILTAVVFAGMYHRLLRKAYQPVEAESGR